MDEGLFKILLAIISIIGTIITYYLVPYLKTKISIQDLEKYREWATLAVKCAEMLFIEQGMGTEKKAYVIDFLNKLFNKEKVVITEEQLNVLIEAAVNELNMNKNKKES